MNTYPLNASLTVKQVGRATLAINAYLGVTDVQIAAPLNGDPASFSTAANVTQQQLTTIQTNLAANIAPSLERQYMDVLDANKIKLATISMNFNEAIRTGAITNLATAQNVISAAVEGILNPTTGLDQGIKDHFNNWRSLMTYPALAASGPNWASTLTTLALCRTWLDALFSWLGMMLGFSALAVLIKQQL